MVDEKEVIQGITKLVNPRTMQPFTEFDARRILRAAMKRRLRAAKYQEDYRKTRREISA